jgi:hypothetical protein
MKQFHPDNGDNKRKEDQDLLLLLTIHYSLFDLILREYSGDWEETSPFDGDFRGHSCVEEKRRISMTEKGILQTVFQPGTPGDPCQNRKAEVAIIRRGQQRRQGDDLRLL